MSQHGQRIRVVLVARREDLDRLAVLERQPQILHAAVRPHEHGFRRELRPDRARGFEARCAFGKLELGIVGKDDPHELAGYGTRYASKVEDGARGTSATSASGADNRIHIVASRPTLDATKPRASGAHAPASPPNPPTATAAPLRPGSDPYRDAFGIAYHPELSRPSTATSASFTPPSPTIRNVG